jgi:hypothetical protein
MSRRRADRPSIANENTAAKAMFRFQPEPAVITDVDDEIGWFPGDADDLESAQTYIRTRFAGLLLPEQIEELTTNKPMLAYVQSQQNLFAGNRARLAEEHDDCPADAA